MIKPAERLLHLVDMGGEGLERFPVVGQRQEVVEVFTFMGRPGEVAGDEEGINAINKFFDARKMPAVDAVGTADRDADRMHRDRVVAGDILEQLPRMGIGEEVLGVDFEPGGLWTGGRDFGDVLKPQADPGSIKGVGSSRHERVTRPLALMVDTSADQAIGSAWPPTIRSQ